MLTQTTNIYEAEKVFNNELWRSELVCKCGHHVPATHNAYCSYCALWLIEKVAEPVVQEIAASEDILAEVEAIMQSDIFAGQAQGLIVQRPM